MKGQLITMSLFLVVASIAAFGCGSCPAGPEESKSSILNISEVEEINLYQDGEVSSPDRLEGISGILLTTLQELNLQARCALSQERIDKIKQKDTVAELILREPVDIIISQFVAPEERHHIATDGNGYRILEKVKSAVFVLEDNLNQGLWAHVLVGSEHEGRIGYGCWAVQREASNGLDISWVCEIASACEFGD